MVAERVFADDGIFFAGEDDALFPGLETVDEPEFVLEDGAIDEDGVGLGLNDFVGGGGASEVFPPTEVHRILLPLIDHSFPANSGA